MHKYHTFHMNFRCLKLEILHRSKRWATHSWMHVLLALWLQIQLIPQGEAFWRLFVGQREYFFFYMLFNSKWSEIFQAYSQLALKVESKEAPPFWTFFHTNLTLWSAAAHFFARPKRGFLQIQMLISCNAHCGNFWIFFYIFSNQHTTRSYSYIYPKMFFLLKLGTYTRNGSFEAFFEKT